MSFKNNQTINGKTMCNAPMPIFDANYNRFAGWTQTLYGADQQGGYNLFFSMQTVNTIQSKVKDLLQGVEPSGRPILVTPEVIRGVMDNVYNTRTTSNVGDIYARYNINGLEEERNPVQEMIDRTIEIIYSNIKTEYEMIECNNSMSAWNALYGDFNPEGLRAHSKIKLKEKKIPSMQFNNMRY